MKNTYKTSLAILIVTVITSLSNITACSVPVFRYAMERWDTDPYLFYIFHDGKNTNGISDVEHYLSPFQDTLGSVAFQPFDTTKEMREQTQTIFNSVKGQSLPLIAVTYPMSSQPSNAVWSGTCSLENVKMLLSSPARKKIGEELLKGTSAVYVFIKSGNPKKDQRARKVVEETLKEIEKNVPPPEIDEEDQQRYMSGGPELKISFSLLTLDKNDPKEKLFIKLLTNFEPGTAELDGPFLIPIFGRGRALCTFAGEGINSDNIADACQFVSGACSCQVKDLNPGVDMLMDTDWSLFFEDHDYTEPDDQPLPDLTSVTPMIQESADTNAAVKTQAEPKKSDITPIKTDTSPKSIQKNVIILLFVFGLMVIGASAFILKKK